LQPAPAPAPAPVPVPVPAPVPPSTVPGDETVHPLQDAVEARLPAALAGGGGAELLQHLTRVLHLMLGVVVLRQRRGVVGAVPRRRTAGARVPVAQVWVVCRGVLLLLLQAACHLFIGLQLSGGGVLLPVPVPLLHPPP